MKELQMMYEQYKIDGDMALPMRLDRFEYYVILKLRESIGDNDFVVYGEDDFKDEESSEVFEYLVSIKSMLQMYGVVLKGHTHAIADFNRILRLDSIDELESKLENGVNYSAYFINSKDVNTSSMLKVEDIINEKTDGRRIITFHKKSSRTAHEEIENSLNALGIKCEDITDLVLPVVRYIQERNLVGILDEFRTKIDVKISEILRDRVMGKETVVPYITSRVTDKESLGILVGYFYTKGIILETNLKQNEWVNELNRVSTRNPESSLASKVRFFREYPIFGVYMLEGTPMLLLIGNGGYQPDERKLNLTTVPISNEFGESSIHNKSWNEPQEHSINLLELKSVMSAAEYYGIVGEKDKEEFKRKQERFFRDVASIDKKLAERKTLARIQDCIIYESDGVQWLGHSLEGPKVRKTVLGIPHLEIPNTGFEIEPSKFEITEDDFKHIFSRNILTDWEKNYDINSNTLLIRNIQKLLRTHARDLRSSEGTPIQVRGSEFFRDIDTDCNLLGMVYNMKKLQIIESLYPEDEFYKEIDLYSIYMHSKSQKTFYTDYVENFLTAFNVDVFRSLNYITCVGGHSRRISDGITLDREVLKGGA